MARTYGYALAGALIATFTVTPVLASPSAARACEETETIVVRGLHRPMTRPLRFALSHRGCGRPSASSSSSLAGCLVPRLGSEFLPALEEGNFWIRASMPMTLSLQDGEAATRKMRQILLRYPEVVTVVSQHGRPDDGSDASPFSNVELFAPLKPATNGPPGSPRKSSPSEINAEFERELPGRRLQLLAIYPGQRRGGASPASRQSTQSRSSARISRR